MAEPNRLWFLFERAAQSFCGLHCVAEGGWHHRLCVEMSDMIAEEKKDWKVAPAPSVERGKDGK